MTRKWFRKKWPSALLAVLLILSVIVSSSAADPWWWKRLWDDYDNFESPPPPYGGFMGGLFESPPPEAAEMDYDEEGTKPPSEPLYDLAIGLDILEIVPKSKEKVPGQKQPKLKSHGSGSSAQPEAAHGSGFEPIVTGLSSQAVHEATVESSWVPVRVQANIDSSFEEFNGRTYGWYSSKGFGGFVEQPDAATDGDWLCWMGGEIGLEEQLHTLRDPRFFWDFSEAIREPFPPTLQIDLFWKGFEYSPDHAWDQAWGYLTDSSGYAIAELFHLTDDNYFDRWYRYTWVIPQWVLDWTPDDKLGLLIVVTNDWSLPSMLGVDRIRAELDVLPRPPGVTVPADANPAFWAEYETQPGVTTQVEAWGHYDHYFLTWQGFPWDKEVLVVGVPGNYPASVVVRAVYPDGQWAETWTDVNISQPELPFWVTAVNIPEWGANTDQVYFPDGRRAGDPTRGMEPYELYIQGGSRLLFLGGETHGKAFVELLPNSVLPKPINPGPYRLFLPAVQGGSGGGGDKPFPPLLLHAEAIPQLEGQGAVVYDEVSAPGVTGSSEEFPIGETAELTYLMVAATSSEAFEMAQLAVKLEQLANFLRPEIEFAWWLPPGTPLFYQSAIAALKPGRPDPSALTGPWYTVYPMFVRLQTSLVRGSPTVIYRAGRLEVIIRVGPYEAEDQLNLPWLPTAEGAAWWCVTCPRNQDPKDGWKVSYESVNNALVVTLFEQQQKPVEAWGLAVEHIEEFLDDLEAVREDGWWYILLPVVYLLIKVLAPVPIP